jgi:hypothetical protein
MARITRNIPTLLLCARCYRHTELHAVKVTPFVIEQLGLSRGFRIVRSQKAAGRFLVSPALRRQVEQTGGTVWSRGCCRDCDLTQLNRGEALTAENSQQLAGSVDTPPKSPYRHLVPAYAPRVSWNAIGI